MSQITDSAKPNEAKVWKSNMPRPAPSYMARLVKQLRERVERPALWLIHLPQGPGLPHDTSVQGEPDDYLIKEDGLKIMGWVDYWPMAPDQPVSRTLRLELTGGADISREISANELVEIAMAFFTLSDAPPEAEYKTGDKAIFYRQRWLNPPVVIVTA